MTGDSIIVDRLGLDSAVQDFDDLVSIQSQLAIALRVPAGACESDTGFLISAHRKVDYQGFIRRGDLLLGARHGNRGRLVGYLLASAGALFLANHPTTKMRWDSEQRKNQLDQIYSTGAFTYLDQIGVALPFHGTGVAHELHQHLVGIVGQPIIAAVLQEPVRNARSMAFFKKLGYLQIGTFHTAELKGLRDVRSAVLALYGGESIP